MIITKPCKEFPFIKALSSGESMDAVPLPFSDVHSVLLCGCHVTWSHPYLALAVAHISTSFSMKIRRCLVLTISPLSL